MTNHTIKLSFQKKHDKQEIFIALMMERSLFGRVFANFPLETTGSQWFNVNKGIVWAMAS